MKGDRHLFVAVFSLRCSDAVYWKSGIGGVSPFRFGSDDTTGYDDGMLALS